MLSYTDVIQLMSLMLCTKLCLGMPAYRMEQLGDKYDIIVGLRTSLRENTYILMKGTRTGHRRRELDGPSPNPLTSFQKESCIFRSPR